MAVRAFSIDVILFLAHELTADIGMDDLALRFDGVGKFSQEGDFFLFIHGKGIDLRNVVIFGD